MRVTWVHPSWRDLVIGALAADPGERRRFLARCGVDGAALALSAGGGAAGERRRPLLRADADWDALADGLHRLCGDLEEADAVRLLTVLDDTEPEREVTALRALVVRRLAARWRGRVLSVDALVAWTALASRMRERPELAPSAAATWIGLEPAHAPTTPVELERFADWLRLTELLHEDDPELLSRLGFPERHAAVLDAFADAAPEDEPPAERELRVQALGRLLRLAPDTDHLDRACRTLVSLEGPGLPLVSPVRKLVRPPMPRFPVRRVLADLVE